MDEFFSLKVGTLGGIDLAILAGTACGLALEQQVLEDVPVSEHDMKVHMLVTDVAVRRFAPATTAPPESSEHED